jgi:hypothetical protein
MNGMTNDPRISNMVDLDQILEEPLKCAHPSGCKNMAREGSNYCHGCEFQDEPLATVNRLFRATKSGRRAK